MSADERNRFGERTDRVGQGPAPGTGSLVQLARAFLGRKTSTVELSPAAAEALGRWRYPGNVRELRNVIDRALLLCDGATIEPAHLPFGGGPGPFGGPPAIVDPADGRPAPSHPPLADDRWPWGGSVLPLAEVERRYLAWAERHFAGERRALADALGMSERTLYRKLERLKHDR